MPFAEVNGIRIYYEIRGQGEPVLLISGLGSDANTWSALYAGLGDQYRFIAFENRGAGRSSRPLDSEKYSIESMAEDAAALLDALDVPRAHVIGKSMGGMIAQVLAMKHPQRVRSLVLNSTLLKHDAYGRQILELGRLVAQTAGVFATFKLAFLLSYSREYCERNQTRLAEAEQLLNQFDSKQVLAGYIGQSLACERHDSSAIASRISAPALVITGKDDLITPAKGAEDLAATLSHSELVIMQRGGHGVWREYPEDVNPIVGEFLSRQSAS